jgi:cysteinyl-tRNA synthetase
MLHIHNSLTKNKELLKPIIPGKIRMYVCGMTVYDYCHIGHGRIFVVFDMVARYLRSQGYEVTYVRNITDIDDKIINRARENGEDFTHLTERFIQAMHEDEKSLELLPPDVEPKATQHIPSIIALIEKLVAKGYAYIAENGDVYYEVNRFSEYGQLSHQSLDKLRHGARVDVLDIKHDPLDFVLWKLAKPGEPVWDSPWGKGRPGWHIECSAMSTECLGEQIDIHGGGLDLVFPHHQNEVAQSEGAFNKRFVNIWMHVGYVQMDREKMSKSLGNFSTIREVLAQYDAETVRYFMLASHYRSPINYSHENLQSARFALERLYTSLRALPVVKDTSENAASYIQQFNVAMDDDFNTPLAMSVLFDLAREMNRLRDEQKFDQAAEFGCVLKRLGEVFGILQKDPQAFLQSGVVSEEVKIIEALIEERNVARHNKRWEEADRLRDQLLAMKVVLDDTPQGTIWRKL